MDTKKKKEKPLVPWQDSFAKELLRRDLVSGAVPLDVKEMSASEVYQMREEYIPYGYKNFETNLRNLRNAIIDDNTRTKDDEKAFTNFRTRHPKQTHDLNNGKRLWHGSPAEAHLAEDMEAGKHVGLNPEKLWATRSSYQEFSKKKFRDHIDQAKQTEKYYTYRTMKTQEEEAKRDKLWEKSKGKNRL